LVGSRRLDPNDAASQEAVSMAMGSLRLLVDKWIDAEVARGGGVLRIDTLMATHSENVRCFRSTTDAERKPGSRLNLCACTEARHHIY
jgi:hypothetical protein